MQRRYNDFAQLDGDLKKSRRERVASRLGAQAAASSGRPRLPIRDPKRALGGYNTGYGDLGPSGGFFGAGGLLLGSRSFSHGLEEWQGLKGLFRTLAFRWKL